MSCSLFEHSFLFALCEVKEEVITRSLELDEQYRCLRIPSWIGLGARGSSLLKGVRCWNNLEVIQWIFPQLRLGIAEACLSTSSFCRARFPLYICFQGFSLKIDSGAIAGLQPFHRHRRPSTSCPSLMRPLLRAEEVTRIDL